MNINETVLSDLETSRLNMMPVRRDAETEMQLLRSSLPFNVIHRSDISGLLATAQSEILNAVSPAVLSPNAVQASRAVLLNDALPLLLRVQQQVGLQMAEQRQKHEERVERDVRKGKTSTDCSTDDGDEDEPDDVVATNDNPKFGLFGKAGRGLLTPAKIIAETAEPKLCRGFSKIAGKEILGRNSPTLLTAANGEGNLISASRQMMMGPSPTLSNPLRDFAALPAFVIAAMARNTQQMRKL
jgi:hypothetical protein